jgi:hypothetical protein
VRGTSSEKAKGRPVLATDAALWAFLRSADDDRDDTVANRRYLTYSGILE